jgi:hypothetical protein
MDANPTQRGSRRKLVLAVAVVALLAIGGFAVYREYEPAKCQPLTPPGCGGFENPMIQHAQASAAGAEDNCQFERINAISWETVCSVHVNGGNTGTINLTVTNPGSGGGGSLVDFWAYSSLPNYINFTAIPACAYTSSTPPLNEAATCNLPFSSTQTFQFIFTVSQSYGASTDREDASVTIVMDLLCCFP